MKTNINKLELLI